MLSEPETAEDRSRVKASIAFPWSSLPYFATAIAAMAVTILHLSTGSAFEVADQPWQTLFAAVMLGIGIYSVLDGIRLRRRISTDGPGFILASSRQSEDVVSARAIQESLQRIEAAITGSHASP
jgi:hypothetical protein